MNYSRWPWSQLLTAAYRLKILRAVTIFILSGFSLVLHAQVASLSGNNLMVPVVRVDDVAYSLELLVVEGSSPVQLTVNSAQLLATPNLDGAAIFDGVNLSIPSLLVDGVDFTVNLTLVSSDPPRFQLLDAAANSAPSPEPAACVRPPSDSSNGPNNPVVISGFSVPASEIQGGGPPPDGIPSIDLPIFTQEFGIQNIQDDTLVVGIKIGDEVRAYPHTIMDWHEIVNDSYLIDGEQQAVTLSYCPLTGSAMLWNSTIELASTTFGTSGLLYNSNLVLYDRRTQSLWSQMLEQSITGPELLKVPQKIQVVETTWDTWVTMYPETKLLSETTGFSRPYGFYPYGSFRESSDLLFPADNSGDRRLHAKARVVGINVGNASKVYPINNFSAGVSVVNDSVGELQVVAAGSADHNFGVVFNRQLADCTVLDFQAMQNSLPVVMRDNEGGEWDVFGNAVTGPRVGTQLEKTNSYIAYWFAWTAFFPGADIHQ